MNYKKWLIPRLTELEQKRQALTLIPEQLRALETAATGLKSPRLDAMPGGADRSAREAALVANIAERDALRRNYKLTSEEVRIMDAALAGLTEEERHVLDCFYLHRSRYAVDRLCAELGYEKTAVYELKERALLNLGRRLFGITEV